MKEYTITLAEAIIATINGEHGGYVVDKDGIFQIRGVEKDPTASCGFAMTVKMKFNTHLNDGWRVGDTSGWLFDTHDTIYADYMSAQQALAKLLADRLWNAHWLDDNDDEDEELVF